jgi:hypothetical protein
MTQVDRTVVDPPGVIQVQRNALDPTPEHANRVNPRLEIRQNLIETDAAAGR